MRLRRLRRRLSGLSHAAGVVLAPKQELRLRQLNFVPLSTRRALAVLVGADGSVENRDRFARRRDHAGSADRGQQFHQCALVRPDARRGRGAASRRNPRPQGSDRRRRGRAGRFGPRRLEPGSCPPPGADRPRPGESDRRCRGRRSRARPPAARRARGSAGDRAAARRRARRAGLPNLHRLGEPHVRFCRARR